MAFARKCDRCGKFYLNDNDRAKMNGKYIDVRLIDTCNLIDTCSLPRLSESVDLCDSCIDEFITWFGGGTK